MKKQPNPDQLALPLQFLWHVQCSDQSDPANDYHHLILDRQKGYETRITVSRSDKKLVGKRIRVRLKTHDIDEAAVRRDVAFDLCRALGLNIRDRRQKKWAKKN